MRVVPASLVVLSTFSYVLAVPVDARGLSSTLSSLTGGAPDPDSTSYGSPGAGDSALVASVASVMKGDGTTFIDAALGVSLCQTVNSLSEILGLGDDVLPCDNIPSSPPADCSASQLAIGPQGDDGSDDSYDDSGDDGDEYDSGDEFDDGSDSDDTDDEDESFSTAVIEEPTSTAEPEPVASPPPNIYAAPVPSSDTAASEPCPSDSADTNILDVAVDGVAGGVAPLLAVAVSTSSNLLDTGALLGGGDALGATSLVHAALGSGTDAGDGGLLGLTHIGL